MQLRTAPGGNPVRSPQPAPRRVGTPANAIITACRGPRAENGTTPCPPVAPVACMDGAAGGPLGATEMGTGGVKGVLNALRLRMERLSAIGEEGQSHAPVFEPARCAGRACQVVADDAEAATRGV